MFKARGPAVTKSVCGTAQFVVLADLQGGLPPQVRRFPPAGGRAVRRPTAGTWAGIDD